MQYKLISPIVKNSTLEQIFYNRGFNNIEDIEHYLNTTDEDIIDPKVITNIEDGAKMLIRHIAENHDVLLQIDSDADGFTSSAILMNYLNCLFPSFVQNHIRYWVHDSKAHGIDEMGISDTVKLVIAPDSSSNEYDKHKELAEKGIDVLIIDHHNAPEVSPYACVINNQLCDYDNKDLSGAGMVYKFCCYIDFLLGTDYANQYLDLASLGIK
jgi:single-stranded-DNA-specific exonuclease